MRQNALQTMAARQRREAAGPAGARLWQALRGRRCGGLKVRRQVPLGPHVVQFYCAEAALVIEITVSTHAVAAQGSPVSGPVSSAAPSHASQRRGANPHAQGREARLAAMGFRVLAIPEAQVMTNLPAVLARIAEEAAR